MIINLNKKNVLILLATTVLIICGFLALNFINSTKESVKSSANNISTNYIEKGLEDASSTIKSAVENYAKYDKNESISNRQARLSNYFTKDSPVLMIGAIKNTNQAIDKIEVSVTSIKSCRYYTSEYPCVEVAADSTFYINNGKYSTEQNYRVSLPKDGSFSKIYDVRLVE